MVLWFLACSQSDAPKTSDSGPTEPVGDDDDSPPDDTLPAGDDDDDTTPPPTGLRAPVPGDLVVTEFMANPYAVDGDFGEFVELTSLAADDVDLEGVELLDDDGDGFVITGSLPLLAGGRIVFGPSDNQTLNGGIPVAFAYDIDALKLGNEGDTLSVLIGSEILDVVFYEEIAWGLVEGASMNLDPAAFDPAANDDLANWCVSTSVYGAGDYGTPGEANVTCP